MNQQNLALAAALVDEAYIDQGSEELRRREGLVRVLLSQRSLPAVGWSDAAITGFIEELAAMDSNNYSGISGGGEREARVYSQLVANRHWNLGHGIGRSGELCSVQPKAAGSSLIYKLTNYLALHASKICGLTSTEKVLVTPLATGMSLTMCLLALKELRPQAKYVLWPRLDQKTCYKCILAAGCTPVVIEPALEGDELRVEVGAIESAIQDCGGPEKILCVVSATSCFAPRGSDRLVEIAALCERKNIGHIVNHAYGLQASKLCHILNEAMRTGRVDAWVSSTDKNFLVPVGGALIGTGRGKPRGASIDRPCLVTAVSNLYPGRASMAPILDLFITLLSMGEAGLRSLLRKRKQVHTLLREQLSALAARHGLRVLNTPHNPISVGLALSSSTVPPNSSSVAAKNITFLGSMLFRRQVSGTRVVSGASVQKIGDHCFRGFGSHCEAYPVPYLTIAAAIGMEEEEVRKICRTLGEVLVEWQKKVMTAQLADGEALASEKTKHSVPDAAIQEKVQDGIHKDVFSLEEVGNDTVAL